MIVTISHIYILPSSLLAQDTNLNHFLNSKFNVSSVCQRIHWLFIFSTSSLVLQFINIFAESSFSQNLYWFFTFLISLVLQFLNTFSGSSLFSRSLLLLFVSQDLHWFFNFLANSLVYFILKIVTDTSLSLGNQWLFTSLFEMSIGVTKGKITQKKVF